MWERTLQDLIRGLRANKQDENKFIAQAVDEIRKEIKDKASEVDSMFVSGLQACRELFRMHFSGSNKQRAHITTS